MRGFAMAAVVLLTLLPGPILAGETADQMPQRIRQSSADRQSLDGLYALRFSQARIARMKQFDQEELGRLRQVDFKALSREDQLDYLLQKNFLDGDLHELEVTESQRQGMAALLPFMPAVEDMLGRKRRMERPNGEATAAALAGIVSSVQALQATPPKRSGGAAISPVTANRAVGAIAEMRAALRQWFDQYNGYDPQFTWWDVQPYHAADAALEAYSAFLKKSVIGIAAEDKTTIIGDPAGRDVLMKELNTERIPYTPEELIAIAETEYDWCMKQMLIASRQMGYGDDWHRAVEKVKSEHVAPGEQPELIRKLVLQGAEFAKQNNLVTVPPLAEETWRMVMMTPERQLVNPFFTGGDEISVSYPTDTMTYEQREMSMRGNNIAFAHATAFHEMIPGHFLQFYMAARYHSYRDPFTTPFWIEGNALWWEMLYWDKGFDTTPEERVGALVWRMHRSARIIFTMKFHLGQWTPQQCVQFLVDAVGFERDNATAEVRRSFDGSVGPLYQSAYLLGALQFRALHHELVDSHRMTDRQFHDTLLQQHAMPLTLLRAYLEQQTLTPDFNEEWQFYGEHPQHAAQPEVAHQ